MRLKFINLNIITAIAVALPSAVVVSAAQPQASQDDDIDETEEVVEGGDIDDPDDENARQNPVFDINPDDDIDIPVPAFINQGANHIIYNGADWSGLRRAFAKSSIEPVAIVHIGDSHIQADMGTGVTRELLQYDFGNAGRGIISPLKMSGTNQPYDYIFSSSDNWSAVKLMSRAWPYTMGFTGTSVHPNRSETSFTIGTSESDDYNPFSSFTVFHGGMLRVDSIVNSDGFPVHFRSIPSRDYTQVVMASQETRVKVYVSTKGDLTLYGISLSGDRPGIFYHAIGNNGATYATYNRIGNVGNGIAPLHPELVILSLGTNEAFGRQDPEDFYKSIDRLVKNIRQSNPEAQLLLVTPMECQKSVSKKVSKRVKVSARKSRKRGKKSRRSKSRYRTVTSTVRSYRPNANIEPLRSEILRYGKENNIAVLDWWAVAGGQGASNVWISNNLFSRDRVHHSLKGYRLQGRLMYDALIDALQNQQ